MKIFKRDIREGDIVSTTFSLNSAEIRKKDEREFLVLGLSDRTGRINGYLWNNASETIERLNGAAFVTVTGKAKTFNGNILLNLDHVYAADPDELNMDDFTEVVECGIEYWHTRLVTACGAIENELLSEIVWSFLYDKAFMDEFKHAPGGTEIHHNYIGGLMQHTTQIMEMSIPLSNAYKSLLNRDRLLTAAFLHDIGKSKELAWQPVRQYTTEGKLIGHIAIGVFMLREKIKSMDNIPDELTEVLMHCILSHHGELVNGSPVKPKIPEALALHFLDNLDAKLNHLGIHLKNADSASLWTPYDRNTGTDYFRYFDKEPLNMTEDCL